MAKADDAKNNWADMMEEDAAPAADDHFDDKQGSWQETEEASSKTKVLRDGTKIVTEVVSKDGGKFEVMKHIKMVTRTRKIFTAAEERKKRWKRFGDAESKNYPEMTVICDNVRLELGKKEELRQNKVETEIQKMVERATLVAGTGGGTFKASTKASNEETAAAGDKTKSTYVPPGGRADTVGGRNQHDDSSTVRISNLSEDISEDDLRELFRKCGTITRVNIVVDKNTKERRGFGFVMYKTREEARDAIEKLHRHPLKHVILEVNWSKPPRD